VIARMPASGRNDSARPRLQAADTRSAGSQPAPASALLLFSVAVFRPSLTQWPKATRRLDRVRKEDTCPSLLRFIRIRIPPARSHPPTEPSRPCHIRALRPPGPSHPPTAPSRPCHRRPTPARINPPRPGDGACVRRCAGPRQALSNGPAHDADPLVATLREPPQVRPAR